MRVLLTSCKQVYWPWGGATFSSPFISTLIFSLMAPDTADLSVLLSRGQASKARRLGIRHFFSVTKMCGFYPYRGIDVICGQINGVIQALVRTPCCRVQRYSIRSLGQPQKGLRCVGSVFLCCGQLYYQLHSSLGHTLEKKRCHLQQCNLLRV